MALSIHGTCPTSVFRLNGADENSASHALGWTLEQSPQYRKLLVDAVFGEVLDVTNMAITLQKHGLDGGYTDVELQAGARFHAILEAKRWWDVPGITSFSAICRACRRRRCPSAFDLRQRGRWGVCAAPPARATGWRWHLPPVMA